MRLFGIGGVSAAWLLYQALNESYHPILVGIVLFLAFPLYVFWGLNGFFDTIAAAVALYGVRAYRQENDGTALLALVSALSLHYRLWYLGPLALVVAVRYARAQDWVIDWRLGVAGALGGGSIASFILSIPGLMRLSETSLVNKSPIALTTGVTPEVVGALAGGFVLLAVLYRYESDPTVLVTLTLAVVSVFVLTQWSPWYPILLTPTLALADSRPSHIGLVTGFYGVALLLGFISANHALLRFLQTSIVG